MHHPIVQLLCLVSAAAAHVYTDNPDKVAVVYTDVKFDDKMALHVLLHPISGYRHVIAVINGLEQREEAHTDLLYFLREMKHDTKNKLTVVDGTNAMRNKSAPHEENFPTERTPFQFRYDDLLVKAAAAAKAGQKIILATDTIHLYQIAPTPRHYIESIVARYGKNRVSKFHLVHGYNSEQYDEKHEKNAVLTNKWLTEIHELFDQRETLILFTNNFDTFNPYTAGSKQKFAWFKGRLPVDILEQAAKDPFHKRKLIHARDALAVAPGIKNVTVPLMPEGFSEEHLGELVLLARKNESGVVNGTLVDPGALRSHFLAYVKDAMPELKKIQARNNSENTTKAEKNIDGAFMNRFGENMIEAFTKELTLELCDANHIVVTLGMGREQLEPMQFILRNDQNLFGAYVEANGPVHGYRVPPKTKKAENVEQALTPFLLNPSEEHNANTLGGVKRAKHDHGAGGAAAVAE